MHSRSATSALSIRAIEHSSIRAILILLFFCLPLAAQQQRLSSDYEIETVQKQLARDTRPIARMAAYLNLGDLYATRGQSGRSADSYADALAAAEKERVLARQASDLTRYANATSYAALASAKLGHDSDAFELFEESTRYLSSSAKTWNLYSSGMTVLKRDGKAAAAARNAVAIAERTSAEDPTIANRLDLAVYRYSLAAALMSSNPAEAQKSLEQVVDELTGNAFAPLRERIAREELFEIYSTTRSDEGAYLSLLNRSRLRLGSIFESHGDAAAARAQYSEVLRLRNDEPTALARMARLTTAAGEKLGYFEEAFAANPYSFDLVRSYEDFAASHLQVRTSGATADDRMRSAIEQLAAGNPRATLATIASLEKTFGANDTLSYLHVRASAAAGDVATARRVASSIRQMSAREAASAVLQARTSIPSFLQHPIPRVDDPTPADLRSVVAALGDPDAIGAREMLDSTTFSSIGTFDTLTPQPDGTTIMGSGSIGGVPFRFSSPVRFRGTFDSNQTLRMEYRILGVTATEDSASLLVEPLKVVRQ